jgi:Tol biopolymer transport system component
MDTRTLSRLSSVDAAASPAWTPDGQRVVFVGLGDKERFAIWSQLADGGSPAQKLVDAQGLISGVTVSPDGRSLLYTTYNNNSWDIFRIKLDSARVAVPYLTSRNNDTSPSFSPDGRWVAVVSNESGRVEVYLRSFPDPAARVQISAGGGREPEWSADGTRVFYRSGSAMMSAKLASSPNMRVISRDTALAHAGSILTSGLLSGYDVAKDGRFLGLVSDKEDYQLIVVPNWLPELRQRLAGNAKR